MADKLLPCPFCGCDVRIDSNRDWHRVRGDHGENCIFVDRDCAMMVAATDDQKLLMVTDWNRRAASPADQVEDARDAARYRFIKSARIVLAGGPWAVAPFGNECDDYIDAAMSASKEGA